MPIGHPDATKLKPLSDHAKAELREIGAAPVATVGINPGVLDRLKREGLIEVVQLPSPFKIHKGALTSFAQLTDAGRAKLQEIEDAR